MYWLFFLRSRQVYYLQKGKFKRKKNVIMKKLNIWAIQFLGFFCAA